MSTYIYDQAWHQEQERLRALEELHDEATFARLASLAVGAGWRCLEVGCGAGSVARWLADRVGAEGHVLATDLDPRFMVGEIPAQLEVRRHDIVTDPLEEGAFDLIHARAVLEHIPARAEVLARLVTATRPGGWVVIEDTHFGGAMAQVIGCYLVPAEHQALDERAYRAVAALFGSIGADASFGPRLPGALREAGLVNVGAELHARFTWGGGERDFRRLCLEQLGGAMRQAGLLTEEEIARACALTRQEDAGYLPLPLVTAWGQRPAE
jgi:SAM-dependent methyltransferase